MTNIVTNTGWRLVHDGVSVIDIFHSDGITETIHSIFEAVSETECLLEVARLNLIPLPLPLGVVLERETL